MIKQIKILIKRPFLFLLGNYSKDNKNDPNKKDLPIVMPSTKPLTNARINSHFKNYEWKDDVIRMRGENFTDKEESIGLLSDSTLAKIISETTEDTFISQVQFFNVDSGLLLVTGSAFSKIYKTNDGGNNWNLLYKGEKISSMVFRDILTGWALLKNVIYKTTDGGVFWSIDFSHDEDILNIEYRNNIVWAYSKTKILKRCL